MIEQHVIIWMVIIWVIYICNEALNAKSLIDHLFISNVLLNNIKHYLVSDSCLNFSDRCVVRFNMMVIFVNLMYVASSTLSSDLEKRSYLWVKYDIASYNAYVTTCISICHYSQSPHLFTFPCAYFDHMSMINSYSDCSAGILEDLSRRVVKYWRPCFTKPYWSEELSDLKKLSVQAHNIWSLNGRPMNGI